MFPPPNRSEVIREVTDQLLMSGLFTKVTLPSAPKSVYETPLDGVGTGAGVGVGVGEVGDPPPFSHVTPHPVLMMASKTATKRARSMRYFSLKKVKFEERL
jgi:hypothetical protein